MDLALYIMAFILLLVGVKVIIGEYDGSTKFGVGAMTAIAALAFVLLGMSYHVK